MCRLAVCQDPAVGVGRTGSGERLRGERRLCLLDGAITSESRSRPMLSGNINTRKTRGSIKNAWCSRSLCDCALAAFMTPLRIKPWRRNKPVPSSDSCCFDRRKRFQPVDIEISRAYKLLVIAIRLRSRSARSGPERASMTEVTIIIATYTLQYTI
jgi:hypothetical protein